MTIQKKHGVFTRLLSLLLVLTMAASMLPGSARAADIWSDWQKEHVKPVNALGTAAEYHDTVTKETANGTSSFTVKAKVANHVASLEVTTNAGLAGSKLYAVVFPYAHFTDPKLSAFVTKLNEGTITGANAQGLTTTDYRYCVDKSFAAAGGSVTVSGTDWKFPGNSQQNLRTITVNNTNSNGISTTGDKGTEFYRTYAFAVMSATLGGNTASDYAYGTFIMDAEGNMLEDTYMIRYIKNQNNPANVNTGGSAVSGTVLNQIVPWDNTTNLRSETYSRPGYEFKGWDVNPTRANSWRLYPDGTPSTTTSGILYDSYYKYLWKPWDTITDKTVVYAPGAAFDPNNPPGRGTEYGITNLYAVWYPKSVEFKDDGLPKVNMTVSGKTVTDVPMQTVAEAQVRKNITYTGTLAGTTDASTTKAYAPYSSGTAVVDGETVNLSGLSTYFETGWKLESNGNNTSWKLTGTPKQYSEVPLYFLIQVTDAANNTKDLLLLKIPRIKKAAQPVPTLDANTGLQSQVEPVTPDEGEPYEDGQIFGFYSAGPVKDTGTEDVTGYRDKVDNDNTNMGVGTMTAYYLSKGMVYEYRPETIDGKKVDWTAEGYKDMPNGGWREVPFASGRYNAADLTKIEQAGAKNAKTLMYSTLANGNAATKAAVADKTNDTNVNASAEFKATGWLDSYGSIAFNAAGLPVIHGLTKDDVYEVRFRENANSAESDPQTIKIGGVAAAAPSGGGSGLLFNLMKGSVWAVTDAPEPPEEQAVTEVTLTVDEHGSVTVENLEPKPEATAPVDEGEEPTPKTYTNGTYTFSVKDPEQPCTVTATADEGYTAAATIGGEAAELKDSTLTLPKTSADGKLTVSIRFTANETPDTPETHADTSSGTAREVTETLFAVSPTGALPNGSAANLTEEEHLELRDPSGEKVETVTFFTSTTGTVIETYTCTLSEDKKSLVWTQGTTPVTQIPLDGQSQGMAASWGGKADPSDFSSIVFYDWDETTVLGSIVVAKGQDSTEEVRNFENSLRSPESKDMDTGKESYWVDDSNCPMTYKRGYSFKNVWLPLESGILTHYGSEVQGAMVEKPAPDQQADFSNVTGNMIVKACYEANSELYVGSGAGDTLKYYTTELISNVRVSGNVFMVEVKVKRENVVDGKIVGVPRLGIPAVRVKMQSGTLELPMKADMSNTDEYIIQVVPSTLVDTLRYAVVDTYQDSNWPNAPIKSNEAVVEKGGVTNNLVVNNAWSDSGTYSGNGFYFDGTVAMFNEAVRPGGTLAIIDKSLLDEFLLNYKMVKATPNIDIFKARACPALIQQAFNELNGITSETPTKPNYQSLTYKQIQYAIANNGALLLE